MGVFGGDCEARVSNIRCAYALLVFCMLSPLLPVIQDCEKDMKGLRFWDRMRSQARLSLEKDYR